MKTRIKKITLTAATVLFGGIILFPMNATASGSPSYKPCPAIAQELGNKIVRLKRLAAERKAQGDDYGDRRLRSMANVINAHRGNLPCVNQQTCLL